MVAIRFIDLPKIDIYMVRTELFNWWRDSKRSFPWRDYSQPYNVLIAEILLHRTRAEQIVPVYKAFLLRFPTLESLANSNPIELKSLYFSAGLHWRWELLCKMVKEIQIRFHGKIPENRSELLTLPGISDYIASAFLCFAHGQPQVLMDTNTVRVAGRIYGIQISDSSRRSKIFHQILANLLDQDHPKDFNLALIDLAATICKSSNPVCVKCPLRHVCTWAPQEREIN